jgi:hypothetical protein
MGTISSITAQHINRPCETGFLSAAACRSVPPTPTSCSLNCSWCGKQGDVPRHGECASVGFLQSIHQSKAPLQAGTWPYTALRR